MFIYIIHKFFYSATDQHMLLPDFAYRVRMFIRSPKGDQQTTTEYWEEKDTYSSVNTGYLHGKDHQ